MKKTTKAIGLAAAMAVMIPFSAYAATSTGGSSAASPTSAVQTDKQHPGKGGRFGMGTRAVDQSVLDLLKLDRAALQAKLKEGKSLAEIAEEQGVSRDALKQALIDANAARLDQMKQEFANNADDLLDAKGGVAAGKRDGVAGAEGFAQRDLSAAASALGMTVEDLKTALQAGKTLADVAKEKNVEVQTLIDAETAAIQAQIQQQVQDGKLTQDQADKRLARAADLADKFVNGGFFRGGGRGHHGSGGSAQDSGQSQSS
ncbi:hypothetical protein [Cohnella caldifontis]|uniref:hypothetical protein n=1 Tax=Cohnella caldifontis TaxID=3027471 RepID=UPI0023EDF458|nr:hypothetical protein [Cohnella sp. YIM B05605]